MPPPPPPPLTLVLVRCLHRDILGDDIARVNAQDRIFNSAKSSDPNYSLLRAENVARLAALADKRIEIALLLAFFTGVFQLAIGLFRREPQTLHRHSPRSHSVGAIVLLLVTVLGAHTDLPSMPFSLPGLATL